MSIGKKRLLATLEQKKQQEEFPPFQARQIPATTLMPLYSQIVQKNEQRRCEIKALSKSMTMENERPFSFYFRDKTKEKKRVQIVDVPVKVFANPIPLSSRSNLF